MLNGWQHPRVGSRRGAAHRRRGQPCQDSVLLRRFTLRDGMPLTVLAVADGHGGTTYVHSDVGSAVACQVVAELVGESLAILPGGNAARTGPELLALRRWLAAEVPLALHQRWLAAVRNHWLEDPLRGEDAFTPLAYGTTLGFLLLAPRWWALAGLGDWDLVRVDSRGDAEVLSQEVHGPGAGEVTGSLCQEPADVAAGFRSWVWPLAGSEAPFALALSTDGIRKSCASDADFLALAAWLAAGVEPEADGAAPAAAAGDPGGDDPADRPAPEGSLAAVLDRISAEGCGDDVSVAAVQWGTVQWGTVPWGTVPKGTEQGGAGHSGTLESLVLARGPGSGDGPAAAGGPPGLGPPPSVAHSPAPPSARRPPRRRSPSPVAPRSVALLPLALAGGLALLAAAALRLGWPLPWLQDGAGPRSAALVLPPTSLAPLRAEVARLCANTALVEPSLNTRRSQLLGLRRGTLRRDDLLAAAARDPLGGLIAAGFDPERPRAFHQTGEGSLALCPALRRGLETLWTLPDPPLPGPIPSSKPNLSATPAASRRER